ncbi:MAG: hypothetical protein KPEEDBHJ_01611 [Anaerolineales bacterium]|nr:hypothetical protein [Anaerolineales bacterium]
MRFDRQPADGAQLNILRVRGVHKAVEFLLKVQAGVLWGGGVRLKVEG